MTTFEHALLGVNGTPATGLRRRRDRLQSIAAATLLGVAAYILIRGAMTG